MEVPSIGYFASNFLAWLPLILLIFPLVIRPLVVMLVLPRRLGVLRRILITLVLPLIIVRIKNL